MPPEMLQKQKKKTVDGCFIAGSQTWILFPSVKHLKLINKGSLNDL